MNAVTRRPKRQAPTKRVVPPMLPKLDAAQWPQTEDEWKEAVEFIANRVEDIMKVCNKQAGPNAYDDAIPYDQAVLLWYGHIADHLIQAKKIKRLEQTKDFIDV